MQGRSPPLLAVCWLLAGCYTPFPHDRHDLVDFRIVGLQVGDAAPEPGSRVFARALLYGGEGFFHDELPTLSWSLDDATATGPEVDLQVPLQEGRWELQLVATHADGQRRESAVLPLSVGGSAAPLAPPELPAVSRSLVADLSADSSAEQLTLDQRELLESSSACDADLGGSWRLGLDLSDPSERFQARWMTSGGRGSFFELDHLATDWIPATMLLDDEVEGEGEVQISERLDAGVYGAVVLVIDGQGANAWRFFDLPLQGAEALAPGVDSPQLLEHAGRLFWLDSALPADTTLVQATLELADNAWGLWLTDVEAVQALADDDPYGTLALGCPGPLPLDEPFSFDWLAEARCSRQQLDGQRVVLEVQIPDCPGEAP